jgi:5-methylcytosine-specific restriction protein A
MGKLQSIGSRVAMLDTRTAAPTTGAVLDTSKQGRRQRYDRERAALRPSRKWYGSYRWQKLRAAFLDEHPLCAYCQRNGFVTLATVCDHVTPHFDDGAAFWAGPFQSLCKQCHDGQKQSEENAVRFNGG